MINKTGFPVLAAAFLAAFTLAACGQANSGASGAPGTSTGPTGAGTATSTTIPSTAINQGGGSGGGNSGGGGVAGPTSTVPPAAVAGLARIYVPQGQINTANVKGGGTPSQVQTAGGKYVIFDAEQSGCQKLSAEVTTQSATEVVITVVDVSTAPSGQMCPMIVRDVQLIVELNAPLNNRTIVFQSTIRHG